MDCSHSGINASWTVNFQSFEKVGFANAIPAIRCPYLTSPFLKFHLMPYPGEFCVYDVSAYPALLLILIPKYCHGVWMAICFPVYTAEASVPEYVSETTTWWNCWN